MEVTVEAVRHRVGATVTVTGTTAGGNAGYVTATNVDKNSATTVASRLGMMANPPP